MSVQCKANVYPQVITWAIIGNNAIVARALLSEAVIGGRQLYISLCSAKPWLILLS